MANSFYFYDLETSGFDPRRARIVQFGGQRTDLNLKPVGKPLQTLIKLTPDVVPEPDAVLVTGITPQQTLAEGVTETEFLKQFYDHAMQSGTIFVGFNNVRFDDEFMRFLQYRNFYEPYEWQWRDSRSRWDLLDVVRMTRALRPGGIEWPFAPDGKPANRLEFLTKANHIDHEGAHDALVDVNATIAVARLLKGRQPDLFNYLLSMRDKRKIAELVGSGSPFVYTTGRYPSETLHTSAAVLLARHTGQDALLAYDLRHDPTPFLKMSVDQLEAAWRFTRDPTALRLPVKTIKYNRVPAVAPLGVIKDLATQERIGLSLATVQTNLDILKPEQQAFAERLSVVVKRLDEQRARQQVSLVDNVLTVDGRLYDGFISPADKQALRTVRAAEPAELNDSLVASLHDERLKSLLPLYKARNYPSALNDEERAAWEDFCRHQLLDGGEDSRLAKYFSRLSELAAGKPTQNQQYVLEELQLYGQSLLPAAAD